MIAIINKGGNPLGKCHYHVQINDKLIAEFEHSRPEGLAECLRLAADAVERAKWDEFRDRVNEMGWEI